MFPHSRLRLTLKAGTDICAVSDGFTIALISPHGAAASACDCRAPVASSTTSSPASGRESGSPTAPAPATTRHGVVGAVASQHQSRVCRGGDERRLAFLFGGRPQAGMSDRKSARGGSGAASWRRQREPGKRMGAARACFRVLTCASCAVSRMRLGLSQDCAAPLAGGEPAVSVAAAPSVALPAAATPARGREAMRSAPSPSPSPWLPPGRERPLPPAPAEPGAAG